MGNSNVKKDCANPCEKKLDDLFCNLSHNSQSINYSDLKKCWSQHLDPYLYNVIQTYFVRECQSGLTRQTFKDFFIGLSKCHNEERSVCLLRLICGAQKVSRNDLMQFIVSVLKSVLMIQDVKGVKNYRSWQKRTTNNNEESIVIYGRYFLSIMDKNNKAEFDADDIKNLLVSFDIFLSMMLSAIYQTEEHEFFAHLLPRWKYEPMESGRKLDDISVLDLVKIMFINFELPIDYQEEWRLLFSSAINGESFSRLCGQIVNKGPTVIIIKDKAGNVFGGFAPANWTLSPNFVGDSRSFLFTLLPEMRIFTPSGFNENYQYLNVGQQTMPNGLGMGGKLEYFGLWLSANYGTGSCSESCTTFRNYKMMSATKEFSISHVEVWGVGPPPPTAAELGERSVLDGNVEAKAILEMAGKTAYSDGLREDPKEEEMEFSSRS